MSTEISTVVNQINSPQFQGNLSQVIPSEAKRKHFTRVALTAIQTNPSLLDSNRQSLFNAITRCATDGLQPDGREAALVIMGGSVAYMPMVGGLRKIAARHSYRIASACVYENDQFEYELGIDPVMRHIPPKLGEPRGKLLGAWAMAADAAGNTYLDVMDAAAMEVVRSVSRAKNGDLWTKWITEAYRKTVTRRLFKTLPLDDLDEQEASVLRAADEEMEFTPQQGQEAPQRAPAASGATSRPSALQRVVDAGPGAVVCGGEPPDFGYRQVAEEVAEEVDEVGPEPPPSGERVKPQEILGTRRPDTPVADDPF